MKSAKSYALLLLTLTTIGGAALAWWQYGELVELRASAMNRDERADMQQRIAELEKRNRELQDRIAALRATDNEFDPLLAADGDPDRESAGDRANGDRSQRRDSRRGGPEGLRQQFTAIRELMSKPEVQAMMNLQQKGAVEARYSTFFKNLNLSGEQTEQLKTLLAERGNTQRDVEAAARSEGINPRENPEAYRKLVADAQNELNDGIKSVIGEQGFAQLQNYEQTMPQRSVVENLQKRLDHVMPLTSTQAEQLVQILATNSPPPANGSAGSTPSGHPLQSGRSPDFGRLAGAFGVSDGMRGGASVTPAAVSQAQSILAPPQLAVLEKIQQQQQAQQQVQQLLRETAIANQPTKRGSDNPGAATGKNAGGAKRKAGGGK